jgi:A/G-specific adenine glycosylase
VVDGNVVRVLTRLFGLKGDPSRMPLKSELWRIAGELVDPGAPGDFNQAVMELGAVLCSPTSPRCERCPVARFCLAYAEGRPETYPETASAPKATAVRMAAAVIQDGNRVVLDRRPEDAVRWACMWGFPSVECGDGETEEAAAVRIARKATGLEVRPVHGLGVIRHSVTRYRIALKPVLCEPASSVDVDTAAWRWVETGRLGDYALPAAHQKIGRLLLAGRPAFSFDEAHADSAE